MSAQSNVAAGAVSNNNANQENKGSNVKDKISIDQWEEKMEDIVVSKDIINKIVMNYLIVEGYKQGALKFQKETGIKAEMDEELIDARIEIRKLIEKGGIEEAINKINNLNPEILDKNVELYFELKRQQLVELIKTNQIEAALLFAQTNLSSSIAKAIPDSRTQHFQAELEKTMTLLMYEDLSKTPGPLQELADVSSRHKLASRVNQAILQSQGYSAELKLGFYWQLLQYGQKELTTGENGVEFPKLNDPMGELEQ